MARRLAILIGNGQFRGDSRLSSLRGPANDVQYFGEVLENPEYGGFEVTRFVDTESHALQRSIESSLNDAERDDLVLLYYSGHGKLDSKGQLCLATSNTSLDTLRSTSLSITFLKGLFDDCRSNRIVLILDCCFSGAAGKSFAGVKGTVEDQLALAQGSGIHILTSSTAIETSAEREQEKGGQVAGVFTRCMVDGILSGDADIDQDAAVTVEDLRRYLGRRIRGQSPKYWGFETTHDVVIARNPRVPLPASDRSSREGRDVRTERTFTLPVTILSVAALGSEMVRIVLEGAEGRGSASWAPAITSALVAVLPWARSAEPRYRSFITTGLVLFLLTNIVDAWPQAPGGTDPQTPEPGASAIAWARRLFEMGGFIALATAFVTRGGAYPSPLLIPYAVFAVVVVGDVLEYGLNTYGLVRSGLVIVAAYTAAQAWYRQGNPGASWAAFGGIVWLGFQFVEIVAGGPAQVDSPLLSLPAAATWLIAMSVRETVTGGIRSHPASSRWVLAGSLTFLVWFVAARLNVVVLERTEIYDVGPVAAAATGAVVWGVVGGLIVAIFEGPSRAWPWKLFLATGLLAAVACWLLVENAAGYPEMSFDAALACSVWALPLLVPFARETSKPTTPLDRQVDRALWIIATVAIASSALLIPGLDSVLGPTIYRSALVVAGLGSVACVFLAQAAYRRSRQPT